MSPNNQSYPPPPRVDGVGMEVLVTSSSALGVAMVKTVVVVTNVKIRVFIKILVMIRSHLLACLNISLRRTDCFPSFFFHGLIP